MPDEQELTLLVVIPQGSGECREFQLEVAPQTTGEKLKSVIEKSTRISVDDMELFAKNEGEGSKQKWIKEDETLAAQDVKDGAVLTVGVHGMRNEGPDLDADEGEAPTDAVGISICSKGDASYYHAHRRRQDDVPEEHRIVSGGAPQKLGESDAPLPEPQAPGRLVLQAGSDEPARPERAILSYSWGDEPEVVKIYISAENEQEAVAAAGDGKNGQVDVKWLPKACKLRVRAEKYDWVLDLDKIYYEIVPAECKFRVSQGKRVTLTLKKREKFTWLKLLKPDS